MMLVAGCASSAEKPGLGADITLKPGICESGIRFDDRCPCGGSLYGFAACPGA